MGACCDSKPFGKPCGDCAFDDEAIESFGATIAAPASDHTHVQDGQQCGGASPCPVRSGRLRGDEPVLRDLSFGLASTVSSGADSAMEATAGVRGFVSRGTAGSIADRQSVLSYIDGVAGASSATGFWFDASPLGAVGLAGPNPFGLWDFTTYIDHREIPPYESELGADGHCCVKKFCFPWRWSPTYEKTKLGAYAGVRFMSWVEYKPASEEAGCDCKCCVFKQYVQTFGSTNLIPEEEVAQSEKDGNGDPNDLSPPTAGAAHEDCRTKGEPAHYTGKQGAPPKGTKQADLECYGDRKSWPTDDKGKVQKSGESAWSDHRDPCNLYMKDWPKVQERNPGPAYTVTTHFTGRIYDRCNNMMLVEQKFWGFEIKGPGNEPTVFNESIPGGTRTKPPKPDGRECK